MDPRDCWRSSETEKKRNASLDESIWGQQFRTKKPRRKERRDARVVMQRMSYPESGHVIEVGNFFPSKFVFLGSLLTKLVEILYTFNFLRS